MPTNRPVYPFSAIVDQEKIKLQFTKALAEHIKKIRDQKGITQEDLAFKAGINTAYLGHLERGIYSPTMFVIWRIADALDMSMEEFMKAFEA